MSMSIVMKVWMMSPLEAAKGVCAVLCCVFWVAYCVLCALCCVCSVWSVGCVYCPHACVLSAVKLYVVSFFKTKGPDNRA